jgi:hypothetical protein
MASGRIKKLSLKMQEALNDALAVQELQANQQEEALKTKCWSSQEQPPAKAKQRRGDESPSGGNNTVGARKRRAEVTGEPSGPCKRVTAPKITLPRATPRDALVPVCATGAPALASQGEESSGFCSVREAPMSPGIGLSTLASSLSTPLRNVAHQRLRHQPRVRALAGCPLMRR